MSGRLAVRAPRAALPEGMGSATLFVEDGRFPWNNDRRATLADVQRMGDVVLLRYALSDRYED